jgi:hypothetical protein
MYTSACVLYVRMLFVCLFVCFFCLVTAGVCKEFVFLLAVAAESSAQTENKSEGPLASPSSAAGGPQVPRK